MIDRGTDKRCSPRILCALKRSSAEAPAVARFAAALARRLDGRLLLAHVVEPLPTTSVYELRARRLLFESARAYLSSIAADASCEDWAQQAVRLGETKHELRELAERWRPDFAVCGSRGHGALRAKLANSISRGLIGNAGRPVIVVPPRAALRWDERADRPPPKLGRAVVCGVDGSSASHEGVRVAAGLARKLDTRLVLVHARPPAPPQPSWALIRGLPAQFDEAVRAERSSRLRMLRRAADVAGGDLDTETMVEGDQAASGLDSVADRYDADLIVIGSRGRGPIASALLGSTAIRLVRSASHPVLVVAGDEAPGYVSAVSGHTSPDVAHSALPPRDVAQFHPARR